MHSTPATRAQIIIEQQAPQKKRKVSIYPTKLTILYAKQPEQEAVIDAVGRAIFHHIRLLSYFAQLAVNVAVRL